MDKNYSDIPLEASADISENYLAERYPRALEKLLYDHTAISEARKQGYKGDKALRNILWATDSYEANGPGYGAKEEICIGLITGEHGRLIQPRAVKTRSEQYDRTKQMAEVFTPAWVCNEQNNVVDDAWFGRGEDDPPLFNEVDPVTHVWRATEEPIPFPEGKTWQDYVLAVRWELTCGEAPYLVSRYDTTTGELIHDLRQRIGLLDRKLRVVSENVHESKAWCDWAKKAYQSLYGFEWQGDSLLLAREALLVSFIEYHRAKFWRDPHWKTIESIGYIISWNVFQMDGLRGVLPGSCDLEATEEVKGFFESEFIHVGCPGCQRDSIREHNGVYALVKDWRQPDPKEGTDYTILRFIDLLPKKQSTLS